jgi:hypothetical protein
MTYHAGAWPLRQSIVPELTMTYLLSVRALASVRPESTGYSKGRSMDV